MGKGMKLHHFYHSYINHSNTTVCNIPVQRLVVIQIGFRRRTLLLLTLVWFITTTNATTIVTATFGSSRSNPMLALLTSLTVPLSFGRGITSSSKAVNSKYKINFVTAYRQLSYHYRYHHDHQYRKPSRKRFYTTKESIDKNDPCTTNDSTTRTSIHELKQQGQEEQQEQMKQNYIFGYGSLMCPLSREITNKNLINKFTIPICIYNIQRQFCARTTTGYTAMGIQFVTYNHNHDDNNYNNNNNRMTNELTSSNTQQRVYTTGILIGTIDSIELKDLDLREASYDRVSVPLNTITTVPFIDQNVYSYQGNHEHSNITTIIRNNSNSTNRVIEQPTTTNTVVDMDCTNNNNNNNNIKVWVYVPKNPIYPDTSHPILQSYIDIIIRGCYNTYGEQFARSFITTTNGWIFHSEKKNNNYNKLSANRYWVNDRDFPLYKRADRIYSTLNAAKIDHILLDELNKLLLLQKGNTTATLENESTIAPSTKNIIPLIRRTKYDPILHLEQLVLTLQNDNENLDSINNNNNNNNNNKHSEMVHPTAFHHFVSRMNNFEQS